MFTIQMDNKQNNRCCLQAHYITVATVVTVMFVLLTSCKETLKETIPNFESIELVPTLRSNNVSTLVSDSGITRYRIETLEWLMYDKAEEPYWYFPQGIYVEKFDTLFAVEAMIEGDTATFFKDKQLWHLQRNVKMQNLQGEIFKTEELFWNQKTKRIYSDQFIHIERADRVIEGYGFDSNEEMTKYTIHKTQGTFPIKQNATKTTEESQADSLTTDTTTTQILPR